MPSRSLLFRVQPSASVPIHRQLMDQVIARVAEGRLAPGDPLPSVRTLARELEVNATTISKAFVRLEEAGVLVRRPGIGMEVAAGRPAPRLSVKARRDDVRPLLASAAVRARQVGLGDADTLELLRKILSENPS